jgi:urea transporter
MLARIPLIPVVMLTSFITLIATVLVFVGAPLAGSWSAIMSVVGAAMLTIPLALAFSHHDQADAGHSPR